MDKHRHTITYSVVDHFSTYSFVAQYFLKRIAALR